MLALAGGIFLPHVLKQTEEFFAKGLTHYHHQCRWVKQIISTPRVIPADKTLMLFRSSQFQPFSNSHRVYSYFQRDSLLTQTTSVFSSELS